MIESVVAGAVSILVAIIATYPAVRKLKREAIASREDMRAGLEQKMASGDEALRRDMMSRIEQISRHLEACERRSQEQAEKIIDLSAQVSVITSERAILIGKLAGLEARQHRITD